MVEVVRTTLKATLAPPTRRKEEMLQELLTTYREALHEAFNAGADTMSAVNDIVTPYDLPYQIKDALKSYVPQLKDSDELKDEHPLRLVNRAAKFDRDESRHHEICWEVPQPGWGSNFWIPLRINPDQKSLWIDVLDGEVDAGDIQLQKRRGNWVVHVSVKYEVECSTDEDDVTHIGFDIGESALVTGCALKHDTPTKPMIESGSRARRLRKEMHTTLKRLQERKASDWRRVKRFEHFQDALTDIVEKVSRKAVDYASSFENPVIVLEDLSYIRERLDYGKYLNRRLHSWAFARIRDRIEEKATDEGIPVRFVDPSYTSQTCHACNHIGRRKSQAEFRCTNDDCHITDFQADINAAANIAGRVNPWGESVPWKPERDDTPQDGSTSDSATARRKPSAKLAQTTLTEWG